jgi:hypothetical protein
MNACSEFPQCVVNSPQGVFFTQHFNRIEDRQAYGGSANGYSQRLGDFAKAKLLFLGQRAEHLLHRLLGEFVDSGEPVAHDFQNGKAVTLEQDLLHCLVVIFDLVAFREQESALTLDIRQRARSLTKLDDS